MGERQKTFQAQRHCEASPSIIFCIFIYLVIRHMNTCLVQFSSGVSDSLQPPGLQHARPPCPSPTPGVYSNSCPLSRLCHPTISSSVVPFSSWLPSFPASGSFPISQSVFRICTTYSFIRASLVAQVVNCVLTMWETRVWSLSQEDPQEEEMATHSSILAWKIPWKEEPGGL